MQHIQLNCCALCVRSSSRWVYGSGCTTNRVCTDWGIRNNLIINFDKESEKYGLGVLSKLREAGIASEIYPDSAKMKKQFSYADKKNIPFTLIIGSDEIESGELTLKNMTSGEQAKSSINDIINQLK